MSYPSLDLLYLSEEDMIKAGVTDVVKCTDCMEELLKILDKGDYRMGGENGNSHGCMVTFPDEPEFPHMPKNAPDRRFMAMPAYVGGKFDVAGMKWYGSNVKNREKELPRYSATRPIVVSAITTFTGSPLEYFRFSSNNFAADFAMFIVCSSRDSLTFSAPLRPSIVGLMPITGYSPIYLFFAIIHFPP